MNHARLPRRFLHDAARCPNAVLLQTSRFDEENHTSYLFLDPVRLLKAERREDIPGLFRDIEVALSQGLWVAGYLSYECGYHFQRFQDIAPGKAVAWFGVYERTETFDHDLTTDHDLATGVSRDDDSQTPETSHPLASITAQAELEISKADYVTAILKIKEYLADGDTYQVNFTDRLAFRSSLAPEELFSVLSRQQGVSYSAFLNIPGAPILSFSPELFFKTAGDRIFTRPMKGTMPRGIDLADDLRMAHLLRADEKNRSEHVMIVDLLRNDLGRICRAGTVSVVNAFSIERYDTLHQMTSKVAGSLVPGMSFYRIFEALFPSGSITGAPKHRTMQIIRELEKTPRGIYTGAIGFISPARLSAFNVAIRTLVVDKDVISMGVGGGIVADSQAEDEYRECLLKAAFITRQTEPFQLIETLFWDGEFKLLNYHLQRMQGSAEYFGFKFNRARIASALEEATKAAEVAALKKPLRIRLTLAATGKVTTEASDFLNDNPEIRIWLTDEQVASSDLFLRHKTTRRELYDRLYGLARQRRFADVIFTNERGEITEGAISNIFLERDGRLLTPPLTSGVLPGVGRRNVLENCDNASEAVLTSHDLITADRIYLCSSLRGMRRVASFSNTLDSAPSQA